MQQSKQNLWRRFGFTWAASFGVLFAVLAHYAIKWSGLDPSMAVPGQGAAVSAAVLAAGAAIAVVSCIGAIAVSDAVHAVWRWLGRRFGRRV